MFIVGALSCCREDTDPAALRSAAGSMAGVLAPRNPACYYRDADAVCMVGNTLAGPSEDVLVVYAGQLFNQAELCVELGCVLERSVENVLVAAYRKWGAAVVDHLQGELTLAIYDKKNESLLLARDRVGMRPMYYARGPRMFLFASEVKALRPVLEECKINGKSVHDCILLHSVYAREHLLEGIFELRAGHVLTAGRNEREVVRQYWDRKFIIHQRKPEDYEEGLKKVLDGAICKRLPASGSTVGISLSGGVDSTLVTALVRKFHAGPVETYTVIAEGDLDGEGHDARRVAGHFNTAHHEITVSAREALESIPRIIWNMGEFTFHYLYMNIAVQTYFVGKAARERGCGTVFTGNGVEHNFDGNGPQRALFRAQHFSRNVPRLLREHFFPYVLPERVRRRLLRQWFYPMSDREAARIDEKYIVFNAPSPWGREALLKACYAPSMLSRLGEHRTGDVLQEYLNDCQAADYFNKLLYLDFKTWNSRRNLVTNERLLGGFGVEMQIPFLDVDVVEFTSSMPINVKHDFKDAKFFIRKIYKDTPILPGFVFNKGKRDSIPCFNYWEGRSLETLLHFAAGLRSREVFEWNFIERALQAGKRPSLWDKYLIFGFFVLELWFRIFVDRKVERGDERLSLELLAG